jgi:hypothetical protein
MSEFPEIQDLGVDLDDLIRLVRTVDQAADEFARLGLAVVLAERLGQLGDHLIGHFVDEARAAGASWRAIGEGMGVTKQAAQKRFVPGAGEVPKDGLFGRFTERAKRAVETARTEARRMNNPQVATEHLLLGLLSEREGLAAQAIAAQGVTPKQVRGKIADVGRPTVDALPDHIPFAPESKKMLEMAVREALKMGHNYIGTEHLLLGLLADESLGTRILLDLGVSKKQTSQWLAHSLAELVAKRTSKA